MDDATRRLGATDLGSCEYSSQAAVCREEGDHAALFVSVRKCEESLKLNKLSTALVDNYIYGRSGTKLEYQILDQTISEESLDTATPFNE